MDKRGRTPGSPSRDHAPAPPVAEARAASERKLLTHLQQTWLGMVEWDRAFRVVEWNPAAEAMFGYAREEALGLHGSVFVPETARDHVDEVFSSLLVASGGVHSVNENVTKGGRAITCEWFNTPLVDPDGTVSGVISLVRDVTEQESIANALRESEEKFGAAFFASPDSITITSLSDGTIVDANEGFSRLLGYQRLEALGKTTGELAMWVVPADRARLAAELSASGEVLDFETTLRRKDGSYAACLVSARVLDIHDGPCFLAVVRDVTEQKRAEKQLRESEARLDEAQRVAGLGSWDWDIASGRIAWSRELHELLGHDPSRPEPTFEGHESYMTPGSWSGLQEAISRTMGSGEPFDIDLEVVRGNDHAHRVLATRGTPTTDSSGHVARMHGTAQDVTERRAAEAALEERRRFVENLVESLHEAVSVVAPDGTRILVNQTFADMTGFSREEILASRPPAPFWPPEHVGEITRAFGEMLRGEITEKELVFTRKDGERFPAVVQASAMRDDKGHVAYRVMTITDITERKRAENEIRELNTELEQRVVRRTADLEAANAELSLANTRLLEANLDLEAATNAKSDFLAAMSHDLRTPMNSILGFSGILLQGLAGPLSEEQQRQVSMINNSGKHLLELINHVLDLSRIEAGRITLSCEEHAVSDLVDAVGQTVRPMAKRKGLELRCAVGEGCTTVCTDRTRVEQVLLNLLGNAIKFTDVGHIDLSVRIEGKGYAFAVSDTGCGVRSEEIDRIFEDFYQVRRPSVAKEEGTGLGLAISRRIAHMLGGDIRVESELGVGSTFTLWLPAEAPGAVPDEEEPPAAS